MIAGEGPPRQGALLGENNEQVGAMLELIRESFSLVNLPYTVLLLMVIVYWGLYVLGAVGSDVLESAGLDIDADVDADVDVESGEGAGWLPRFIYIGQLPVTFIFSVLIVWMWVLSVLANHWLENSRWWVALAMFPPIALVAAVLTKTVIAPFAPMLRKVFDDSGDVVEVVGKRCVIRSLSATPEYGQAEIATGGAPLLINVRTSPGVTLRQDEEAVIYEYDEAKGAYVVARFDTLEPPAE